jgi:predicted PurR-regulated permease PerM
VIDRFSPLARNVVLLVLAFVVVWFCWSVRSVLNPLILGYLLAFILHPLVLKLERRGWSRRKAVNVIFGAFAVLLLLLGTMIVLQAQGLARAFTDEEGLAKKVDARVEDAIREHQKELQWLLSWLPHRAGGDVPDTSTTPDGAQAPETASGVATDAPLSSSDLWRAMREWWQNYLSDNGRARVGEIGAQAGAFAWLFVQKVFGGVLELLGLLVLWPIYTYFLLFELERIHRFVRRYLPHQERDRIVRIGTQIGEVLASFFRGRLLVCLAKGTVLAFGLWLSGVDYALILGLGTGFLSLIPFVGSAIGFLLALTIGMLEFGLTSALWRTGAVFLFAEMLENYLLIPKILGNSLGLHPIVVIFAIMAGGASMGMFGLLLALPITASLVILAREFLLPVLAQMADKPARPKPS